MCVCGHWYEEHEGGTDCVAPNCRCLRFRYDPAENTVEAIAARGGEHREGCRCRWCVNGRVYWENDRAKVALRRAQKALQYAFDRMKSWKLDDQYEFQALLRAYEDAEQQVSFGPEYDRLDEYDQPYERKD